MTIYLDPTEIDTDVRAIQVRRAAYLTAGCIAYLA